MTILDTPSAAAIIKVEQFPTAVLPKATVPLAGTELMAIIQSGNDVYAGVSDITAAQSVQTQNLHDLIISGNTAGVTALVSSGTLTLAGGNNITLSQAGNAITISGAAGGGANFSAGVSNLGNTLGSTGLTGTQLVLVGGNNVTLSQSTGPNGGSVTISAFNQSAQTQDRFDLTISGNTAGAGALVSSGTLALAGGNNITLSQAGNAVTISGAALTAGSDTIGMSNLGNTAGTSGVVSGDSIRALIVGGPNVTISQSVDAGNRSATLSVSVAAQTAESNTFGMSNLGNTAGTSGVISGNQLRMLVVGGPNITVSQSTNASSATLSISAAAQTVQTQNLFALTISSNTAGAGALVSSGTLTLAAGANITLSQNAGNAITIIGPSPSGGAFSAGVSNLGNTAGSTGVSGTQLVLVGTNGISLSQSTGAAGATVSINFTQSAESNTFGASNLGNTVGTSGVVSGNQLRMIVVGGPNVTISQSINGSSVTQSISVAAQTVQTQNLVDVTVGGVNTNGVLALISSGTMTLAASGPLIISQAGNGLTFSASNVIFPSDVLGMSNLGNTAGTTGGITGTGYSFFLAGGDNITLSQSAGAPFNAATISISANPPFVAGVSNLGNTAGATGATSTRLVLVGSNNITLSQTTGAAGATVSIIGAAGGAAGTNTFGASNLGNTLGTSGVISGTGLQMIIVGTNNVTISQSINGSSATLSVVGPTLFSAGISNLGNTAGTSGLASNRIVLVGTDTIKLSQSSSGDSATISFGENVTFSQYAPFMLYAPQTVNESNATAHFHPFKVERYASATRVDIYRSFSLGSTGTITATHSHAVAIYTKNASTLSAATIGGASVGISYTSTQSNASYNGMRRLSIGMNVNLTPGEYWLGVWYRSSGGQLSASDFIVMIPTGAMVVSGDFGAASNASAQVVLGMGALSASSTTLNSSVAFSDIVLSNQSMWRMMYANMVNLTV